MSVTDSKTNVNYSTENKLKAAIDFNQQRTLADELNSLHMYDSTLLGKYKPSQINKVRRPLETEYKTISTVSGSKYSQKKHSNSLMNRQQQRRSVTRGTNRRASISRAIVGHYRGHVSHSLDFDKEGNILPKVQMSEPSSSALSHRNILEIANKEVEVIKGRKINQLSPITRNINKDANQTLIQLN